MSNQQTTAVETLAAEAGTDPGIPPRERRRAFARGRQCACHLEKRKNDGSYRPGSLPIDARQSRYAEHAGAAIPPFWRAAAGGPDE